MKEFKCGECGKYLGEMEKGKIHKKTTVLCEKCMKAYKTFKSLAEYKKNVGDDKSSPFDDMFGNNGMFDGIFGNKGKG